MDGTDWAAAPLREKIGAILLRDGAVDAGRLTEALTVQHASGGRLGDILTSRGWATRDALTTAAARQAGARRAELAQTPLDASLMTADALGPCLAHGMAPWRREGDRVIYVAADHATALRGLAALPGGPGRAEIALAPAAEIAEAMRLSHGPLLAARAATRAPAAVSARTLPRFAVAGGLATALAAVAAMAVLAPAPTLAAAFAALVAVNSLNAGLRVAALARALAPVRRGATTPAGAIPLAERRPRPRVTLLIPLLDEPETLPMLMEALERLDWPRELLDVKLILEADDVRTRAALAESPAPPFCHVLTVPPGGPRTKPRALNYALDFAEGEIVGVYDAEDRPEPDQIVRAVATLRAAPPEVACVQCRLSYYNTTDGWLTRCFTIEYAIWFDVLLHGYRALRLPIPLGGTSLFFRRAALEQVGAWDAHNVTEDAELGMRLARAGFETAICDSTTHEEASSRPGQWLRQRSRWLKGYMTTWLTHMRRPDRLWRDLGPRGFIGFQAIFLGAAAAYLGLPLFWAIWIAAAFGAAPVWLAEMPMGLAAALAVTHLAGWAAMLLAAAFATARRGERRLWPWIPTLALYWPLGAAAAWLALIELALAPALWRKTRHGLSRGAPADRAAALARRAAGADARRRARG